jgi:hypothetical protein
MSCFCYQCTRDVMGADPDRNDFVGETTIEDTEKGLFACVLCEGCGAIQVDHNGMCVSKDCLCNGHVHEICSFNPCLLTGDPNPKGPCKFSITENGKKVCGYG